ncbi:MAG: hypothetical protein AB7O59_17180 [Pirellulales bacterium]
MTKIALQGNPFSTRFVRPGAIEYLFAPGDGAARMIERLSQHGWRGQIIGPHGVGKSTLLASLLQPLSDAGRPAQIVVLHNGQRQLPGEWQTAVRATGAKIVVVDGYEQLGRLARWRLNARCRRAGWGLLITAHRDMGLPTVAQLQPSAVMAHRVVERLVGADVSPAWVADAWLACEGNVREMLFLLYDRHERSRRCNAMGGTVSPAGQVSERAGCADFSA